MSTNLSLLQNFSESNFYKNPIPHVIIENALPLNIYEKLIDEAPNDLIPNNSLNNLRGDIFPDQLKNKSKHSFFYDFLNYNSSTNFYEEFIKIFNKELEKFYPGLISHTRELINKSRVSKLLTNHIKNNNNMTFTAAYSYNTPVSKASSIIGPHLDHYDKIFFGLYYMRQLEDDSKGGDLVLYKWKDKYSNFNKKNIIFTEKWSKMDEHTEQVKKIKYNKNTFVLALNSINSLHGVSLREKTKYIRQFCYFSVTSNNDLGFATPNILEKILFKNISFDKKLNIILNSIKYWFSLIYKKLVKKN